VQSSYGVAILSRSYFERHWTMAELNALAARENDGKKLLLPVWHDINRDFVLQKSPLLADRFAGRSSDGIDNIVRMIIARIRKDTSNTVMAELEGLMSAIENKDLSELKEIIVKENFPKLKKEYRTVLYAINFFELSPTDSTSNVFRYVKEAIVNRPEDDAKELFGVLLDWYVESTTSACNEYLLHLFLNLVKLPFAKEVIREKRHSKIFVIEFGKADNWKAATLRTEILVNIQTLLSQTDKNKIVKHIISNDQIYGSIGAKDYLYKMLDYFEGDVDPDALDTARRRLG